MLHSYYNEVVYSWSLLFLATNNKTNPLIPYTKQKQN